MICFNNTTTWYFMRIFNNNWKEKDRKKDLSSLLLQGKLSICFPNQENLEIEFREKFQYWFALQCCFQKQTTIVGIVDDVVVHHKNLKEVIPLTWPRCGKAEKGKKTTLLLSLLLMSTLVLMAIKWICFRFCFPGLFLKAFRSGEHFRRRKIVFPSLNSTLFLENFKLFS